MARTIERHTGRRHTTIRARPARCPTGAPTTTSPVATRTKAIEAFHFLESITSGVQGGPGFREAAAGARVQDAIMRSRDGARRGPVAGEE